MAENFGYTFAPTFANAEDGKRGGTPPQQASGALRTLNYSLPRVAGAASISPLVSQPGAGGALPFSNAVLQSVLKTILGTDAVAAMNGMPSGSQAPTDTYGGWMNNERGMDSGSPSPFARQQDTGASALAAAIQQSATSNQPAPRIGVAWAPVPGTSGGDKGAPSGPGDVQADPSPIGGPVNGDGASFPRLPKSSPPDVIWDGPRLPPGDRFETTPESAAAPMATPHFDSGPWGGKYGGGWGQDYQDVYGG